MGIPSQILIQGDEVVGLIPQKAPIVMVDTLYECTGRMAVTGLTIRADNMFCETGLFREAGIIEHIAQSAALKAGYERRLANLPVVVGYIGAVKNFVLHYLPAVDNCLVTTIEVLHVFAGVSVLSGKVECNGREVASCEMKVFDPQVEY